jgi:hypothetical protein
MKQNYYEQDTYYQHPFDDSQRMMEKYALDPNEETFCREKFNFN